MLKKSLYVLSVASLLSASTTMCYKKDHMDPSTIETIALDGGKCAGKLSVTQMKKDGYVVDSMKLQNGTDGLNYIYIFEKKSLKTEAIDTAVLTDAQLSARIENIQNKKKLQKVAETKASAFDEGKKIYESTCKRCHGDGTVSAYNTARPLKELSLEEMELSIQNYKNGTKDNGMAILMRPYAGIVTLEETKGIFEYLKTLK
jgi:cytochrome c553